MIMILLSLCLLIVVLALVFIIGTTHGVHSDGFWRTAKRLFWDELIK